MQVLKRRLVMSNGLPPQVKPDDDVIAQVLQDDIVLLKLNSQEYYGLDEVGAHAWKLLAENGDVAAAGERLCQDYAGDADIIRSDFQVLVAQLIEAGLLKAADVNASAIPATS
jgi:hypothetical protein